PRGGHRARADVVDVVRANLARAHVGDELVRGKDRGRETGPEELDHGNEREPREYAAPEEIPGDARPDDVPDARQLRADFRLDLAEELRAAAGDDALKGVLRNFEPQVEARCQELVQRAESESHEDRLRLNASL